MPSKSISGLSSESTISANSRGILRESRQFAAKASFTELTIACISTGEDLTLLYVGSGLYSASQKPSSSGA